MMWLLLSGALAQTDGDPHLWLEEVEGERALETVKAWNDATIARFEADPRFSAMQEGALEILTSDARLETGSIRGGFVYNFWRDPNHTRGLWRRAKVKSYAVGQPEWDVLLDLDALAAAEHENWVWHGAQCAPKSDRCLVELSRGGSDAGVLREFSMASRGFVDGGFFVPEAKTRAHMVDADTVVIGTDTGEGSLTSSGYPRMLRLWRRGTDLDEAEVLLEGETSDVMVSAFTTSHRGASYTILVRSKTFYTDDYFLVEEGGTRVLELPERFWFSGVFDGSIIGVVNEDWKGFSRGTVVSVDLESGEVGSVFVPTETQSVEAVAIGRKGLFVQLLNDVIGEIRRLRPSKDGWSASTLDLPSNGQVDIVSHASSRDDVWVTFESLTQPVTLYHVDKRNQVEQIAQLPAFFDASDVVVEQRFVKSKDGTRVPYFVMGKQSVLESGPAPTIQYGYGGFMSAILPTYFRESARPQHGAFAGRLWVADGGVLVLSNIRGGSEYGPRWHQAALESQRQRAYEDFFAIGEALVADGVTTPEMLGAIGRSNGGLLMGVVLTQRPDLYNAIDCGVPLLDMMRYHKLLAGASWMGEYGDPDVPAERAVLEAYSPYQNLTEGVEYPRVLFYTSTRDDRVHPGHARKMAAALEALGVPFEYWENLEGGHGGVANQEQAAFRIALELLYFKRELGL